FAAALSHAAISPEKIENVRGLVRDHKLAAAESASDALIAANPADPEARALLGSVLMAKGDADPAVEAYEKAAELAPMSGEYQRQLGDAYGFATQKAGMFSKMSWAKKCRIAYEKAVELEPTNIEARNSVMTFYQQAPSMMGGGLDKAYAQASEIRKLDATRGHIAYATLYAGEKKYSDAFTELDEVLKASPDHYLALYQFGRLTAISGERIDQGMDALKKCLALPPPPGSPNHDAAHWRRGNLWEKKGDKKAARAEYEAALAVNPNFPQAIDALKKLE
ncbi:MAG: Tetratricopeptide repeat protein, partial [Verrucomicrobia bacterium]|nr:Tetratricopeptide repeat protein [Verrucomicrobiota bacterium]